MGGQLAKLKKVSRTPKSVFKDVDKVLEQKKVSPRHPTTAKAFDDLVKANPHFTSAVKERNINLNKMLEAVRVDSTGVAPDEILYRGKLPKNNQVKMHGKLSYQDIDDLFLNRKMDPETWSSTKVSEHYNLDIKVAENLLNNYSSFRIFKKKVPEKEEEKEEEKVFEKDPSQISSS